MSAAVAGSVQVGGSGSSTQVGESSTAAKMIEPVASPSGGTRPVRWRITTPAQPQKAAPTMPASTASSVLASSAMGPSRTMSATPAMPRMNPVTRRGPSGSFSTGAEMIALQSGTMPFITAR